MIGTNCKRLVGLIVIGLALSFAFIVLILFATREPMLDGKPITSWVRDVGSSDYFVSSLAVDELRHGELQSARYLLGELERGKTTLSKHIQSVWSKVWLKLPPTIQRATPIPNDFRPPMDRRSLVHALADLVPNDPEVVSAIIAELKSPNSEVRFASCNALGALATNQPTIVIPVLIRALSDTAHNVRGMAAGALGKYGSHALSAIPALIVQLRDSSEEARWTAARALGTIGGDAGVITNALSPMLDDNYPPVRAYAAYALCTRNGAQGAGFQTLVQMLKTDHARLAALLLGRIGESARAAIPELEKAMNDSDLEVQIAVANALWLVDGRSDVAITSGRTALTKGGRLEKIYATQLLMALGPNATPLLPELIETLGEKDFEIRRNAVKALGNIGVSASSAVPKLRTLLHDPFPSIRASALESIKKISFSK